MSELRVISRALEAKVIRCAAKILFMHGSSVGDRTCQDWSGTADNNPDVFFTEKEKDDLSFNYEQWNSGGEDYDQCFSGMHDEMVASFAIAKALESILEAKPITLKDIKLTESEQVEFDKNIEEFTKNFNDQMMIVPADKPQSDWISVADRLPDEDGFVIARSIGGDSLDSRHSTGTIILYFSSLMEKGFEFQSQHRASHVTVTHWMQLPTPPK